MPRKALLVAVAVALVLPASAAHAAVIHEPADGISVEWGKSVYFDWAWECGLYRCEWASGLVFTQNPDPNADIWLGGDKPGKVRTAQYYDSHATITFGGAYSSFIAGDWYWRLCSKTLEGEDDKCYYDSNAPRRITVLPPPPPPPPPPPACSNGLDDDGDGDIDLDDSACVDQYDDNERADTRLSATTARRIVREVLALRFGRYWRERNYAFMTCRRIDGSAVSCFVDWSVGRSNGMGPVPTRFRHYFGTVRVRKVDVGEYRYYLRLRRFFGGQERNIIKRTGYL